MRIRHAVLSFHCLAFCIVTLAYAEGTPPTVVVSADNTAVLAGKTVTIRAQVFNLNPNCVWDTLWVAVWTADGKIHSVINMEEQSIGGPGIPTGTYTGQWVTTANDRGKATVHSVLTTSFHSDELIGATPLQINVLNNLPKFVPDPTSHASVTVSPNPAMIGQSVSAGCTIFDADGDKIKLSYNWGTAPFGSWILATEISKGLFRLHIPTQLPGHMLY